MKVKRSWTQQRDAKNARMEKVGNLLNGKFAKTEDAKEILERLIEPNDKVIIEGDNQKQADFLSRTLANVDPERVHDLHMIISSI